MRYLFILSFLFFVSFKISAQSISVSPVSGNKNSSFSVTITGTDISFAQASGTTACPSILAVQPSNVRFTQGSSTVYSSSVYANGNTITSYFNIPGNVTTGMYNLEVGVGEGCPVILNNGFEIKEGQSIAVSPTTGNKGENIQVRISGVGVSFNQGSSTVCPDNINVTTSNVVFRQASATIYPTSVSIDNNDIIADINLPTNSNTGLYDLVVGYGSGCPITKTQAFELTGSITSNPSVSINPTSGNKGENIQVRISGTNVSFNQASSTVCPGNINVTTSNVVFHQASATIYPTSVSLDNNDIVANINFPSNSTIGLYDLIVGYGSGCPITTSQAFEIKVNNGLTITPNSGQVNSNVQVKINSPTITFDELVSSSCPDIIQPTLSNVFFHQASTTINNATTIYPNNINTTDGELTADFSIPFVPSGSYDVMVGSGTGCAATKIGGFTVTAPSISIASANSANRSEEIFVTLNGSNVTFIENGSTVCGSVYNITPSNIIFDNNGNQFHPESITVSDNQIIAKVIIPDNAALGAYTITIDDNFCRITSNDIFYIEFPNVDFYSFAIKSGNFLYDVNIFKDGVSFDTDVDSDCPQKIKVSENNVYLMDGDIKIYPSYLYTLNGVIRADFYLPEQYLYTDAFWFEIIIGDDTNCDLYGVLKPAIETNITVPTYSKLYIYPNPTNSTEIFLDIPFKGNSSVNVINAYGIPVITIQNNLPGLINLAESLNHELAPGIYLVNVTNNGKSYQSKLIITY